MPDHPTPLNDDDLAKVTGGAGVASSSKLDETMDVNAFAKLFQDMNQEMRNSARETRSTEMMAQVEAVKHAANDMRATAEDRMQAAGSASAMAMASASVHGALSGTGVGASALSSMGAGKSGMVEASHDPLGKSAMTDAAHQTSANVAESTANAANDMQKQMMDVVKDVRDKLSAIEQSRTDTLRGISRGI